MNLMGITMALVLALIIIFGLLYFLNVFEKAGNTNTEKIKQEALNLYNRANSEGVVFNSQCLGIVYVDNIGYAVDIVSVPRTDEDNKEENQCKEYREGKVNKFIELDKAGNIVRIM